MHLIFCLIICCMQIFSFAHPNVGNNDVIASGAIHSNGTHTSVVAPQQIPQSDRSYNETKQVEIFQNKVKNVASKFFILMDKRFYKPGDNIYFIVGFEDENQNNIEPEKEAMIWFEDGNHNRIKEFKNFKPGAYSYMNTFKIPDSAATGTGALVVYNGPVQEKKYFGIHNYVAEVEAPKDIYVNDGDLHVVVKANFSDEIPLDGKVTVSVYLHPSYFYTFESETPTLIKTVDMVKGIAKLDFNIQEYYVYLRSHYLPGYLNIEANIEDQLTGDKFTIISGAQVYSHRYNMECIEPCDAFAEDVSFKITYINGTHVDDTESTIELTYEKILTERWIDDYEVVTTIKPPISENEFAQLSFKGYMNENGIVHFKVKLPDLPIYENFSQNYIPLLIYRDESVSIPLMRE